MTKVIEVDEAGRLVLPPEMLGEAKPYARYVVATEGSTLVVQPEETGTAGSEQQTPDQWMQSLRELSEEVGKAWPAGLSAVDAVSEQRR